MAEPEQDLEVTVERVLFPAETVKESDWFILRTDRGIVKGTMGWRPRVSERLILTGRFAEYQGKAEFKFKTAALNIPTDSRGILHYVCEITSGLGTALEEQIWETKGLSWPEVQDGEIPRLKGKLFDRFTESVSQVEQDRAKGGVIAQLLAAGCSMNMAVMAYEKWGKSTYGVIAHDPYRLAELPNYGFSHVDGDIRLHFGIADGDPRRVRAAVVYVLRQLTEGGSTAVKWHALNTACLSKLGGYQDLIIEVVSEMFGDGTLKSFEGSGCVALGSDFYNESVIWKFINQGKAA